MKNFFICDFAPGAGIFKQSMGARNYKAWWNWFLGIDSLAPHKVKNSGSDC